MQEDLAGRVTHRIVWLGGTLESKNKILSLARGSWASCGGVLCPGRVFPPPPLLPLPLRSSVPFLASPCLVFLLLLHTRPRSAHVAAPSPISGFFSLQACAGDGLIFVFLLSPYNSIGASACGIFTRGYHIDVFSPVKVTFCYLFDQVVAWQFSICAGEVRSATIDREVTPSEQ